MPIRWLIAILFVPGSLAAAGLLFFAKSHGPVEIESLESKSNTGGPVFNRIWREVRGPLDIWLMQQSHLGPDGLHEGWDRLAIVVNRDSSTTKFYQLVPGNLRWSEREKEIPFKVACFLCHANGPRAIRPNMASLTMPFSWKAWTQVFVWNLRIKTYGPLAPDPSLLLPAAKFRAQGAYANEPLPAKICALCHNNHWWGRGQLLRQHFMPIRFMLQSRNMPPPGIPLSEGDRKSIAEFLHGIP